MKHPSGGNEATPLGPCPRCGRPVAIAAPRCLYCGAVRADATARPPDLGASREDSPGREPSPEGRPGRAVVVVDLMNVEAQRLTAPLGLSTYEARQRAKGPRYQLLRLVDRSAAEEEAARLTAGGLCVMVIGEDEARAGLRPQVALGGDYVEGGLRTRTTEGEVRTLPSDLLVVVRGPIVREYQARGAAGLAAGKRIRTAGLEGGFRFHLWRRDASHPLELDPGSFAFGHGAAVPSSSLLVLTEWIKALATTVPTDDSFRRLPPALAPAAEETTGVLAAANVLARPGAGRGSESEGPVVLDNLAQFRFYSGWRAAVERQRTR